MTLAGNFDLDDQGVLVHVFGDLGVIEGGRAALEQDGVAGDVNRDLVEAGDPGCAQRADDPPPVGVPTMGRGLDEGRARDGASCHSCLMVILEAMDLDFKELGRALAVSCDRLCQLGACGFERLCEGLPRRSLGG